MCNKIKNAAIYCASSNEINDIYKNAAAELAVLLAKKGINIINGAGNMGLMQVISDAALAVGGTVTGVIPDFMIERGWCHQNLTKVINVTSMHERKKTIAELSDVAIALPGGYGTFEELLEIITWRQLRLYLNPVIILNINGFYDPLIELFNRAINEKFIRPENLSLWKAVETPMEVIRLLND
ncbi:MAG: TIGR00730 family Rossman fold protein [Tannerella sp.]|jgi:uncharacterized protein (TIGR00730 family)|nr:TIGR00730 family Rossman fold protein [Tannerella sp.]